MYKRNRMPLKGTKTKTALLALDSKQPTLVHLQENVFISFFTFNWL